MRHLHIVCLLLVLLADALPVAARPSIPRPPITTTAAGPISGPSRPLDKLVISLEWVPSNDKLKTMLDQDPNGCYSDVLYQDAIQDRGNYLKDLEYGLREMAGYIYQYTERRVMIREIEIDPTGAKWNEADIRILANQSFRPTAFIGGSVTTPVQVNLGQNSQNMFLRPTPILVGRFWDGWSARCGAWSQRSGWRTLGHEWAHYALRLYDEYLERPVQQGAKYIGKYCKNADTKPPTVMARHYDLDSTELSSWMPGVAPGQCRNTPQDVVYGQGARQTLSDFFRFDPPGAAYNPHDPATLVITGADTPPSGPAPIPVWLRPLYSSSATTDGPSWPAPTYLLVQSNTGTGVQLRIIGQGNLIGDTSKMMWLWGASPGNTRLIVTSQEPNNGKIFTASAPLLSSAPITITSVPDQWNAALKIKPVLSSSSNLNGPVGLNVELTPCEGGSAELNRFEIAYCPAGGPCSPFQQPVPTVSGSATLSTTFAVSPAVYGYIYARETSGKKSEAVLWYQLAGGVGPAHSDGLAPMADGFVNVELQPGTLSPSNNQLLYHPELACPSIEPPTNTYLRLVDVPVRVSVMTASGPLSWLTSPLNVRINYDADELARRGIDENRLMVYQRVGGKRWQALTTLGRNQKPYWIAASLAWSIDSGDQASIALGYDPGPPAGPHNLYLPIIKK